MDYLGIKTTVKGAAWAPAGQLSPNPDSVGQGLFEGSPLLGLQKSVTLQGSPIKRRVLSTLFRTPNRVAN